MFYRSLFALLLVCVSCQKSGDRAEVTDIEITEISKDSMSVRALEYGNGKFWFAGSNGKYGSVMDSIYQLNRGHIVYQDNRRLEFRSIAVTQDYTFILTAGNPALIYKISHENDSLALVYQEFGAKVFYDSLKFWNDIEGIALGDPQEDCFTILLTRDGGDHWEKISCDILPEIVKGEAAYAASNSNIALQGDHIWIATGGMAARVWHSPDKGKTWEVQQTPIISGGTMTGIYAVDFYDEKLGVLIGGDWNNKDLNTSNKAITRNGGKTWELIADGQAPGYSSDIQFVPGTEGKELLSVGSPGIWWSGDQGKSWKQLSDTGFYTAAFSKTNQGIMAGSNSISSFQLVRK